MKNILPTLFGVFSLVVFFSHVNFVHASDISTTTGVFYNSIATGTNNTVFGNSDSVMGFCQYLATTSDIYISTTTFRLYKTGAPTDTLKAYVGHIHQDLTPDWDIHATSTNTVNGTSLTTSATDVVFTFSPPVEIHLENERVGALYPGDNHGLSYYCIGVMRTGSSSVSNYYRLQRSTDAETIVYPRASMLSNTLTIGANVAGRVRGKIEGYYPIPGTSSNTGCPDGYECYTLEEMASTTEAVYTVGSTLQIYLGIMLMIAFGIMAYNFTRRFI